MAKFNILFVFYITLLVTCYAISSFDDLLDQSVTCEQKCTKSYAPHTYPNGEENSACQRGCRLFTVTKYITADEPKGSNYIEDNGRSPALILCHRSCVEAYNGTSSLENSCQVGCEKQEQVSLELEKKEQKEMSKTSNIHLMRPVMQIREVTSKVIGMIRIIQTSLTTYFMGDDRKLIAVEGPVKIMVQVNDPERLQEKEHENQYLTAEKSEQDSVVKVPIEGSSSFKRFFDERTFDYVNYSVITIMTLVLVLLALVLVAKYRSNVYDLKKKQKKMKNGIQIPAAALPVKLVRPEDLTKLSLIDDDDFYPTKTWKIPVTNL